MHCGYALAADKHDIKREINRLLRQRLLADGLDDMRAHPPRRARPLMLVVLEAFSAPHSCIARIRRPCARARPLRAARVAMSGAVDAVARTVFDRCHSLSPPDAVAQAVAQRANSGQTSSITKHRPVAAGGPAEQSAPGAAAARRRRPSRDHARARHRRHAGRGRHAGRCRVLQRARGHAAQGLRGACAAARLPGPARVARRGEPASRPGTPAARRRLRDLAEVERPLPGDVPAHRRARFRPCNFISSLATAGAWRTRPCGAR